MNFEYLITALISLIVGGLATCYVRATLKKYREVATSAGLSGAKVAKNMMQHYGIGDLPIHKGRANQNHFDPKSNSITLDRHAYNASSVTAIATACHEVGHACQFAQGYAPLKVRSSLVPVVNFTQGSWFLLLLVGVLLNVAGLVYLAIAFYAVAVIFHAVTLPVEFDASRRALEYMTEIGIVENDVSGARAVLRACALTYVAAALISVFYLVYLIVKRGSRAGR